MKYIKMKFLYYLIMLSGFSLFSLDLKPRRLKRASQFVIPQLVQQQVQNPQVLKSYTQEQILSLASIIENQNIPEYNIPGSLTKIDNRSPWRSISHLLNACDVLKISKREEILIKTHPIKLLLEPKQKNKKISLLEEYFTIIEKQNDESILKEIAYNYPVFSHLINFSLQGKFITLLKQVMQLYNPLVFNQLKLNSKEVLKIIELTNPKLNTNSIIEEYCDVYGEKQTLSISGILYHGGRKQVSVFEYLRKELQKDNSLHYLIGSIHLEIEKVNNTTYKLVAVDLSERHSSVKQIKENSKKEIELNLEKIKVHENFLRFKLDNHYILIPLFKDLFTTGRLSNYDQAQIPINLNFNEQKSHLKPLFASSQILIQWSKNEKVIYIKKVTPRKHNCDETIELICRIDSIDRKPKIWEFLESNEILIEYTNIKTGYENLTINLKNYSINKNHIDNTQKTREVKLKPLHTFNLTSDSLNNLSIDLERKLINSIINSKNKNNPLAPRNRNCYKLSDWDEANFLYPSYTPGPTEYYIHKQSTCTLL